MGYLEHPVLPPLQGLVEAAWSLDMTSYDAHLVVPDGCMDVLASPGGALEAVGAATRAFAVPSSPGAACFGLRLRPGAGSVVFGLDADELVDQTVPLDGVWP